MTGFAYLDAHPMLSFCWFVVIVCAAYFVPVMVWQACVSIYRTPRSPAIVTEITRRRGF